MLKFLDTHKLYLIGIFLTLLTFYFNSFNSLILSDETFAYNYFKNSSLEGIFNPLLGPFYQIHVLLQYFVYPYFSFFRIIYLFIHFLNILFFIYIFSKFININVLKIFGVFIVSHSLVTESLIWVSASFSIIQALIILTLFFLSVKFKETSKFYYILLIYWISISVVVDTKSQALPLILMIFSVLFLKDSIKKSITLYGPLFFYNILYFVFQSSMIQERLEMIHSSTQEAYFSLDFVTPLISIVRSFELLLFPINLTYMYLEKFTQSQIYILIVISIGLLVSLLVLLIYNSKVAGLIIIGLLVCLYMFSPVDVSWYLANRYLYFFTFTGVLGFSVFLHYLINKNFSLGVFLTVSYLFLHSYVLSVKINDWSQGSILFKENSRIVGNHDSRLEKYEAQYLTLEGKLKKGEKVFKSLIDRNSEDVLDKQFWNFYFLNLMLQGKFDEVNFYLKYLESQNELFEFHELSLATYIILSRISGEYNLEAKIRFEAQNKNISQEKLDEIINFYYSYFKSVI